MTGDKAWRKEQRQRIIQQRKKLSDSEKESAASSVLQQIAEHPFFTQPRIIASYMSASGELDTVRINRFLLSSGHTVALPVISESVRGEMNFYSYDDEDSLLLNKYGIKEPEVTEKSYIPPHLLEAVLIPLVGFNTAGDRLGMGGGYYDRMLKKISSDAPAIGLAYDFQQLDLLHRRAWDMPLDEIITPTRRIICTVKYSL